MKTRIRKLVALALVIAMLLTVLPAQAFAVERARWFGDSLEQAQSVSIEEPVEEIKSPAIVEEIPVDDELIVSIEAEEGAFPEGTEVAAEKVELADIQKAVDEAEDVDGKVLYAADITFTKDGEELQPAEGKFVKVTFVAPDLKDIEEATVIHIDTETKKAEPVETVVTEKEDEVVFKAEKFSIYAVVEPGEGGDEARVKINFYGYKKDGETYVPDTEPVATYFVKNSDDTAAKLEQIVTDPGIGEINDDLLFKGWSMEDRKNYQNVFYTEDYVGKDYTTVSEVFTVEGIREFLLTDVVGSIKEGDVIDIYAAIFKYYNVTFFGNKADGEPKWDVSLGTDTVLLRPDDTEAPYYIDMAFSPTANQNFKGWIPTAEPIELKDGNDQVVSTIPATKANISTPIQDVYPNKTAITITGDVVFGVDAPTGAWLVYNANGKGGTYNAPQFYLPNEPTAPGENATPENMERIGYSFGGWYYDADCTEPFSFGGTLVDNTNIYAKWIPVETAPYTIVFWTQNADRTGYDMAGSYRGENGQVGQNIPINLVDNGDEDYVSGVGNGNGHYTGFTVKEEDRNQQVKITPEGDAVLNLHFDRIVYELRFYVYRQEGNGANSYSYAQNSNRGRNVWGIATWYNNTSLGNMPTLDSTRYSIQRADTAIDGYYGYYFVLQAYYGEDISSKWPQYSEIVGPQNNRDPVSFIMMNGTGLKGNSTTDNGYGDGRDTIKGLITRMDEKILGLTNDADGNYLIIRFNTFNSWRYHIFYEQVPGEDYTGKTTYTYNGKNYYEDHVVTSRSSNQNVGEQNPPQYDGFEQTGNSNQTGQTGGTNGNNARWTTNEGGTTLYHTRYYYDRKVYRINYMDGEYVTGRGVHIQNNAQNPLNPKESAEIQQGAVIPDDVGKNYVPAPPAGAEGYVFDGWYLDEACEGEPYVFTTMPVGGITVHAKWRQVEYRVFLHPNATIERTVNGETVIEDDLSLSWGDEEVEQESDKVSMCFRVAWGDKVSLPYGTRKGYEFIGWTTSDGGNYMPGTELNDTTAPDASYGENKATTPTDIIDKFGNVINGAGQTYWISNIQKTTPNDYVPYNTDIDRDWITHKLDLYGLWREVVEGAEGIKIEYNVGEYGNESTAPTDPLLYKDNANAVGQDACDVAEAYQTDYKFLYWVVQKWDAAADDYVDATNSDGEPIICYPGDSFTVKVGLAKADIHETKPDPNDPTNVIITKADYTIRLRAEYGLKETPKDTYFRWYRNFEGDTVEIDSTGEPSGEAILHKDVGLQINEPRKIYTLEDEYDLPIRRDDDGNEYVFLGWARESEYVDEDPEKDIIAYHPVGYDDLYIKWIPGGSAAAEGTRAGAAEGHYEAQRKNGEWVEVTEVAADEADPYQAYYAVWAPYFNVVYSHDLNTVYKVPIIETKGGAKAYDLVAGDNETKGYELPGVDSKYYYGGYYKDAPDSNREWNWENAFKTADGASKGTEFTGYKAGETYYVKEVEIALNHLRSIYRYTYKIDGSNLLTWFCLIASVDDKNYTNAGFEIDGEPMARQGLKSKIKIQNASGTIASDDPLATVDRTNFGVGTAENSARLFYYAFGAGCSQSVPKNKTVTVTPCWETPDGITVKGITTTFTFDGTPTKNIVTAEVK